MKLRCSVCGEEGFVYHRRSKEWVCPACEHKTITPEEEEVLSVLQKNHRGLSVRAIAKVTRVHRRITQQLLEKLKKKEKVVNGGNSSKGNWKVVDGGEPDGV